MSNPMLATLGYSKWDLVLNVKPQNGTDKPYQANLTITLTSKEKADKIAHAGATVPLRYDQHDLQTVSIDSIAMGYPDPYETVIKAFSDQMNKRSKHASRDRQLFFPRIMLKNTRVIRR